MAAALFAGHARGRRAEPEVASAGTDAGRPSMPDRPPPEVNEVMAPLGIDLGAHRGRALTESDLQDADLVVGMTRRHVQESVVLDPSCFPRAFTLKEVVRRGSSIGPRAGGQDPGEWIGAGTGDRTRAALGRRDTTEDVLDPYGGPLTAYRDCARELDELTAALASLLWPAAKP